MYVTEVTISRLSLLMETPTSIKRLDPEVVCVMDRLDPAVVPEDTASTSGALYGGGLGVFVAGIVVFVGGTGEEVGPDVSVARCGVNVAVFIAVLVGANVNVGKSVNVAVGFGVLVEIGGGGAEEVGVGGGPSPPHCGKLPLVMRLLTPEPMLIFTF